MYAIPNRRNILHSMNHGLRRGRGVSPLPGGHKRGGAFTGSRRRLCAKRLLMLRDGPCRGAVGQAVDEVRLRLHVRGRGAIDWRSGVVLCVVGVGMRVLAADEATAAGAAVPAH